MNTYAVRASIAQLKALAAELTECGYRTAFIYTGRFLTNAPLDMLAYVCELQDIPQPIEDVEDER